MSGIPRPCWPTISGYTDLISKTRRHWETSIHWWSSFQCHWSALARSLQSIWYDLVCNCRQRRSRYFLACIDLARSIVKSNMYGRIGSCRGFGHLTITTTPKQWAGCMCSKWTVESDIGCWYILLIGLSVYNGAKWKGMVMRLEDAKPDYKERKRKEDEQLQKKEERQQRKRLRFEKRFMAKDMTPVTDKNVEKKRGWRRGRYGRAIAIMHLRRPDGTQVHISIILFTRTQNELTDDAIIDRLWSQPLQEQSHQTVQHQCTHETCVTSTNAIRWLRQWQRWSLWWYHLWPRWKRPWRQHGKQSTCIIGSLDLSLSCKDKGSEKRLAAMERRMAEAQQKHELISRALNSDDKVTCLSSDDLHQLISWNIGTYKSCYFWQWRRGDGSRCTITAATAIIRTTSSTRFKLAIRFRWGWW